MLNLVFLVGLVLFAAASVYFYITDQNKLKLAFLVSFITLVSYAIMWQGRLTVVGGGGQPIYWTRWLFYIASCTLLMVKIAQLKGFQGEGLVQMLYLTALVMFTGFLAARDLTAFRWVYFLLSSLAYILLVVNVFSATAGSSQWVNSYVLFGWTVFPIVFLLAPTGLGLLGAGLTNLLYLLLDIYTKIIFSVQLASASKKAPTT